MCTVSKIPDDPERAKKPRSAATVFPPHWCCAQCFLGSIRAALATVNKRFPETCATGSYHSNTEIPSEITEDVQLKLLHRHWH